MEATVTMTNLNKTEKPLSKKAQFKEYIKTIKDSIKDLNEAFRVLPPDTKKKMQFNKIKKYKKLYTKLSENTTNNDVTDLNNLRKILVGEFPYKSDIKTDKDNIKTESNNVIAEQIKTYIPELTEEAQAFIDENQEKIQDLFEAMKGLSKLDVEEIKSMSIGLKMSLAFVFIAVLFFGGYRATANYMNTATKTETKIKNNDSIKDNAFNNGEKKTKTTTTVTKKDEKKKKT